MNKQIEELAKDVKVAHDEQRFLTSDKSIKSIAETLYNKGYRKQSEGEWNTECYATTTGGFNWYMHTCSQCGYFYKCVMSSGYDFCPNCGAKMKGGDNDA
jgi:rubrerythrin